jgi:vacuolar-type H+-ATPase subunit H
MTPFKPILLAVLLACSTVTPGAAQQDREKRIRDAEERAIVQDCRQALRESHEERQEALKKARDERKAAATTDGSTMRITIIRPTKREAWLGSLSPC